MKKGNYFYFLSFFCLLLILSPLSAQTADQCGRAFFIENRGQWPSEVRFLSRIGGVNAWITDHGIVYDFYKLAAQNDGPGLKKMQAVKRYGQVVKVELAGVNASEEFSGLEAKGAVNNFFIGNDPSRWVSDAASFGNVSVKNIYNNIDIRYYYDEGLIRYDYVLQPGADVSSIRMRIEGADEVSVVNNELVLRTALGEVKHGRLKAYQSAEVESNFIQHADGTVGFSVRNYDPSKQLVIDPLVYSTFIGGSGVESVNSSAVDASGNIYVTGVTASTNFPAVAGSYDQSQGGLTDVFVSKLNPAGTALLWSTYLGGASYDYGYSLALDASGNVFVAGAAASTDFPVTGSAYDQTSNGDYDAFVTKLNSSGSAILWSTLLGGSGTDYANSLALDGSGNAYIAGVTKSSNFPVSASAYDQSYNGGQDAFAAKISSSGSALTYSTFLGGTQDDIAYSIATDGLGYAYIAGSTISSDFPVTSSAFDMSPNGNYDAFVTKLNLPGSALVYSTFLGGSAIDEAYGIALDASKNVYITGATGSSNFPVTPGSSFDQSQNGDYDAFVARLDAGGSSLTYSTFLGGKGFEYGNSVKVDAGFNAFVTGVTSSADFPVSDGAYDKTHNGAKDVFVSEVSSTGASLTYSTFIGGTGDEEGTSLVLSGNNDLFITGSTTSSDFPVTAGAFSTAYSNNKDGFITKLTLGTGGNNGALSLAYNQTDAGGFPVVKSYVTVTDLTGQTIAGLTSANFTVKEDGVIQSPVTVTPVGTGNNISVGLVLDRSGSMDGQPITDAKSSASQFVDQLQAGDNGAVISFSSDVTIDQAYTTDKTLLKNAIGQITASGSTAMYDALYQALNVTQIRTGRKAIIVMTDGGDNYSTHSQEEVISFAKKFSIPVFTIGLGTSIEEDSLKKISSETGGQYYNAPGSSDLSAIYKKISQQLNTQYLVTYTAKNSACGGPARTVNISVSYNGLSDNKDKQYTPPACNSIASIKPSCPAVIYAGSEFYIDIMVGDPLAAANLFGLTFRLNFDPSYFIYLSAIEGSWFGTDLIMNKMPDQLNGFVTISVSRKYPAAGLNGSGVAARIKFRASSTITISKFVKFFLSNLSATDANGGTITLQADSSMTNLAAGLTVWPGDLNNDGKVDQSDILPLGQYWNTTGFIRSNATMQWTGQPCQPWTPLEATYADATGDGKVNQEEVLAIGLNWSKTHVGSAMFDVRRATLDVRRSDVPSTIIPPIHRGVGARGVDASSLTAGILYLEESTSSDGDRLVSVKYQHGDRTSIRPFGIALALKYGDGIKITGVENGELFGSDVISIYRDNTAAGTLGFGITNKKGNAPAALNGTVAKIKFRMDSGKGSANITLDDIQAQDIEGVNLNIKNSGTITAVGGSSQTMPAEFRLMQNYPNPFNPVTVIEYALPKESDVRLSIYNVLGEELQVLVNGKQSAGEHQVTFDASNLASGTYIYKITAGDNISVKKCILLK